MQRAYYELSEFYRTCTAVSHYTYSYIGIFSETIRAAIWPTQFGNKISYCEDVSLKFKLISSDTVINYILLMMRFPIYVAPQSLFCRIIVHTCHAYP